jgi:protein kinase-like protein
LTKPGGYLGTLPYASPEQMAEGTVDGRSDLYSLGCLLYELLSDHSPYVAESPAQWIAAHQSALPTPLRTYVPDAPAGLEALIHALLAKDPARRPPDADTVRDLLQRVRTTPAVRPTLIEHRPAPAPTKPAPPAPSASPRKPQLGVAMPPGGSASPAQRPRPVTPVPAPAAPARSSPMPYYAWQPVPTPRGWMVVPHLVTPPPPVLRPLTTTVAGRLLVLLAIASAVEAVVVAAATAKVGAAFETAFRGTASDPAGGVILAMMIVAGGYCVAATMAGILAGASLRGSAIGRLWTWILGVPLALFAFANLGAGNIAIAATTPSGTEATNRPVLRALAKVRASIPPWYLHAERLYDIVAGLILLAVVVLLALPPSGAYVRARRGTRIGR